METVQGVPAKLERLISGPNREKISNDDLKVVMENFDLFSERQRDFYFAESQIRASRIEEKEKKELVRIPNNDSSDGGALFAMAMAGLAMGYMGIRSENLSFKLMGGALIVPYTLYIAKEIISSLYNVVRQGH